MWIIILLLMLAFSIFVLVIAIRAYQQNQKLLEKDKKLTEQLDNCQTYLVEGKFHIGDILTACSNHMLAPKKEEGLRELAEYMLGTTVDMAELESSVDKIIPELNHQFPWIKTISFDECNESNWKEFRDKYAEQYGEYLNVNMVY